MAELQLLNGVDHTVPQAALPRARRWLLERLSVRSGPVVHVAAAPAGKEIRWVS